MGMHLDDWHKASPKNKKYLAAMLAASQRILSTGQLIGRALRRGQSADNEFAIQQLSRVMLTARKARLSKPIRR